MVQLLAACVAVLAVISASISSALAQGFPNKTIRIIIPFTPGGSNDIVGRELAEGFQARFKQSAIVENKPGGGGNIAYSYVAKSPPDGYTLMIAPASFTMGPHLTRNPVYNPVTDFAAIDLVADVPFAMVVPASLPVKTVKEFIELAKKSPNKLSFASVGPGTPQHLAGELFKLNAKVDLVHVPFRGATAVLPDLVAGRIDMFIGAINSLLPLLKDGKLRALAITSSPKRIASLPDVPTMVEVGLPDIEVGSGVGLVAPTGTPPAIVAALNREIAAIIADKGFHERMAKIGVDVVGTTAEAYAKMLADDYAKWGKVVAAAKIEPQ
jgi:tripartite-type tricarboxylate transporter receptor subunit TctC